MSKPHDYVTTLNPMESQMFDTIVAYASRYEVAMGVAPEHRTIDALKTLVRAGSFFVDACNAVGGPEALAAHHAMRQRDRDRDGDRLDS